MGFIYRRSIFAIPSLSRSVLLYSRQSLPTHSETSLHSSAPFNNTITIRPTCPPLFSTLFSVEILRLETKPSTSTLLKMRFTDTLLYVSRGPTGSYPLTMSNLNTTVQRQGQGRDQTSLRPLGPNVKRQTQDLEQVDFVRSALWQIYVIRS
jgi:hypothetical protein